MELVCPRITEINSCPPSRSCKPRGYPIRVPCQKKTKIRAEDRQLSRSPYPSRAERSPLPFPLRWNASASTRSRTKARAVRADFHPANLMLAAEPGARASPSRPIGRGEACVLHCVHRSTDVAWVSFMRGGGEIQGLISPFVHLPLLNKEALPHRLFPPCERENQGKLAHRPHSPGRGRAPAPTSKKPPFLRPEEGGLTAQGDMGQAAFPPPPGVTPNFDDPEDISWMVVAAIGATLPLAIVACCLRLYTSKWIVGRWHVDDGKPLDARPPALCCSPNLLTSA